VALALTRGKPGEIYHIGGAAELSNRDLAGRLLELCGAGWDRVVDVPDDKGHDTRYALADDRIRRELGYRPRIDLAAGLAATVRWYRDNEEWWRPLIGD
jgi:dTDP-glucose 4,6-dehydratase